MLRFNLYNGHIGPLLTNENYLVFRWAEPNCKILISMTQQGKAVVCHLASDKHGLRKLKQAINEWCEFCFWAFDWCKMIIGIIKKRSICKLVKKCGFTHIATHKDNFIYVRRL